MGKLEVDDPAALSARLNGLRERLVGHAYFQGVPSFDPARGKAAVMFHAKDDLPEVRFQVFDLLASEGGRLRFHAVVCDKECVGNPGFHAETRCLLAGGGLFSVGGAAVL